MPNCIIQGCHTQVVKKADLQVQHIATHCELVDHMYLLTEINLLKDYTSVFVFLTKIDWNYTKTCLSFHQQELD